MSAPSIDQILTDAENPAYVRVVTARVLLRQDLIAEIEDLERRLTSEIERDSKENRDPVAPTLADEIEAKRAEAEATKVEFRFRSIGHRAWADLLAKHPPTSKQKAADPRSDHNPETFPAAVMAAACTQPQMTADEVLRLERAITETLFIELWSACLSAQHSGSDVPKALAAGVIRRANAKSASTPAPVESPEASSLDEQ